jgi:hypothetical protein
MHVGMKCPEHKTVQPVAVFVPMALGRSDIEAEDMMWKIPCMNKRHHLGMDHPWSQRLESQSLVLNS